jgi:hypothetical protein
VVFLIVLAAAIPRGASVFLAVFVGYCAWQEIPVALYMLRNRAWGRQTWRVARNPLSLLRQMDADRFVPATSADVEALNRGDDPAVESMIARGGWYFGLSSLTLVAASALLWLIASSSPPLALLVAVAWLVLNSSAAVLFYR